MTAVLPVFCRVFPFWLDWKSIYANTLNYTTIDFTIFHFLILDIFSCYVGKYQKNRREIPRMLESRRKFNIDFRIRRCICSHQKYV